jgi:hypothetical protein
MMIAWISLSRIRIITTLVSFSSNIYHWHNVVFIYSVAVDDFDNDFILDIIVANYDSNNLLVLCGHDNGAFANMVLIQLEYAERISSRFEYILLIFAVRLRLDRELNFLSNDGIFKRGHWRKQKGKDMRISCTGFYSDP